MAIIVSHHDNTSSDDVIRTGEEAVRLPDQYDAGLFFIGRARTPWTERSACPRRGDAENGPVCTLEINPLWNDALIGIEVYGQIQLLYWMDKARRDLVRQRPGQKRAPDAPLRSTFALRSPVRPNPIASSVLTLLDVVVGPAGGRLTVRGLDCMDGTPILDIKPVFPAPETTPA